MSDEFSSVPVILFKTLKNTELGAQTIEQDKNGSIVLGGVLKKVTESMLQSYPRKQLGKWTPNRAHIRYSREQIAGRDLRRASDGKPIDLDKALSL